MNHRIPILQLQNIHKSFGRIEVLRNVSLDLFQGEIHALAGENGAGKSTLMKIIGGIHRPSSGKIIISGTEVVINQPQDAQARGISIVHQEIALCPDVTVAEDIMMPEIGRSRSLFMNYSRIRSAAERTLRKLADISPDARLGDLSISNQQLVEICRSLNSDCRIMILDEPTAALTQAETVSLFAILRRLRDAGMAIIYITHRMSEIYGLCDRITVLRDGRHISTDDVSAVTPDEVVTRLVGQKIDSLYPPKAGTTEGPVLLQARGLADGTRVRGVDLDLRRGEILGMIGLIGSGRTELLEMICGLRRRTAGSVTLGGGANFAPEDYAASVRAGVVCLSEDRKANGVFVELPISFNTSSLNLSQVSTPYGFVSRHKEIVQAQDLGARLNLRCTSVGQNVEDLSGGNQQKVAIAKLLSVNPGIMLLDEPTRGIDVGAKVEIHALLRTLANSGVGVLVVSSEMSEVIGLCDRVVVLSEGRVSGLAEGDELTESRLISLAAGFAKTSGPQGRDATAGVQ